MVEMTVEMKVDLSDVWKVEMKAERLVVELAEMMDIYSVVM